MKVGVIGAGAIARRGHLPTYRILPDVEVAGIADKDEALARGAAEEFGIPRHYSSSEELLQDDSIELIDVCTPPQTHLPIVRQAIEKGKHLLVEKPLATSLKDALEIQDMIRQRGTKLCVVQNWRYFPAVTAARLRISRGYLGNVVSMHGVGLQPFPTHWTRNTWMYHHGAALYDFGPHLVDLVLWMKGFASIRSVYAAGGDFTKGDMDFTNYTVLTIEFDDGSIATADISWMTAMQKFTLDINGTGGSIALDVRNNIFSETRGFPTPFDDARYFFRKMWRVGSGIVGGDYFKGALLGYRPLISEFLASIRGNGVIPVPVQQAVMTNAVLDAAEVSIAQNRPVAVGETAARGEAIS